MVSEHGGQPAAHRHRDAIALLRRWARIEPSSNPTELLRTGLESLGFGRARQIGASSLLIRAASNPDHPSITLIGSHDLSTLTPIAPPSAVTDAIRGPGVGSRIGGLLATLAGLSTTAEGTHLPIDVLSVGPGDTLAGVATRDNLGEPDLIVFTDSTAWNPSLPTVTVGSRGRVEAHVTITAPAKINDLVYAGATLNPLNRLVEMLGHLRGAHGRVGLPGFYDRADPPARGTLAGAGTDDWLETIGASRPSGSLSGIERATQWPVMSVLDLRTDAHPSSSPKSASAHLAFSLVPRQRPVEVERTLRAWIAEHTPPTLHATVRITRSARPHHIDQDTLATRALARALQEVHGRPPVAIPAGGTIGAGEVAYRFGAPVLFAGLIGPDDRHGTVDEVVDVAAFADAVEVMRRVREEGAALRIHRS